MEPRERELRYRLGGRGAYDAVLAAALGPSEKPCRQSNHYFDTSDLRLLRAGAMFRLRSSGDVVLTFKMGRESAEIPGFFDALEVEQQVEKATLHAAIERPQSLLAPELKPSAALLEHFGAIPLTYVGCLLNERRVISSRFRLELDRLSFPDGTQGFEIEIETDSPRAARAWLDAELSARGIEFSPQSRTKMQQFVTRARRTTDGRSG